MAGRVTWWIGWEVVLRIFRGGVKKSELNSKKILMSVEGK